MNNTRRTFFASIFFRASNKRTRKQQLHWERNKDININFSEFVRCQFLKDQFTQRICFSFFQAVPVYALFLSSTKALPVSAKQLCQVLPRRQKIKQTNLGYRLMVWRTKTNKISPSAATAEHKTGHKEYGQQSYGNNFQSIVGAEAYIRGARGGSIGNTSVQQTQISWVVDKCSFSGCENLTTTAVSAL